MRRAALIAIALALGCRSPEVERPLIENRVAEQPGGPPPVGMIYASGPITEESLAKFLSERFAHQLAEGTFVADYSGTTEDLLDELDVMGFHDLADLAAIIPPDFDERGAGEFILEDPANIPGLVRDFLMIHDADRYFGRAWKNRWQSILPANVSALKSYVGDFRPFYGAGVLTAEEVRDAPDPPAVATRTRPIIVRQPAAHPRLPRRAPAVVPTTPSPRPR